MNANEMKLSEMLIEKAEWWPSNTLGYIATNINLPINMKDIYPDFENPSYTLFNENMNLVRSWLCLFEAEIQKDIESHTNYALTGEIDRFCD